MKTTIELPDELLTQAKVAAAARRTTLKAMIEHSLRRELLHFDEGSHVGERTLVRRNEYGFPVLDSSNSEKKVSSEMVAALDDESDSP